ncbi:type II toxin-antitoxin system RelE/ParE family toxin [Tamlana sp. 2_MG-2023]|uniref:type II toxin-antitoxin system RelE/ParE family toxin n=1 Tax=unclassified Tamlana TaxID=2614803 RepID=UPI0026E2986F|nr:MULTISPECIES: type II toxin-antitoxin system RelE/ParE family toxin [unclassified Tamlana]MDO6761100.1 type II toxin-antitoxin system RelE/ParE family toxin [Tamlana sp. 2_MG-2023]MDO6791567.1 type II toxin-antitoxin system RelE/ParE family toxin [Tamlana sp. 1_MG-2023]
MGPVIKPVVWTKRALKDLNKISVFNSKTIGKKKALEIAHNVIDAPKILENSNYDFKNIGSIDESFSHLKQEYRKIFYDNYKITYRNGKTKIYITRVFDTRQYPGKNK